MRIRVLAYNILDGGLGREDLIQAVLSAVQPDVAVLEEVYQPASVQRWAEALGLPYTFFASGNTSRHLALMSRFPIVSKASYHPNPPIHTTLLATTLQIAPQQKLHVLGVHLLAQP